MAGDPIIRAGSEEDLPAIADIYAHYVLNTRHSFEAEPPDIAEMSRRWQSVIAAGLPWLVAEEAGCGGVAGYACATPYRARRAYRWTVEDSVYIAPDRRRSGVGRALLVALIEACEAAGCRQMVAVIGDDNADGSVALHRAMGFQDAGRLRAVGFKDGAWVDTIRMQRALGEGGATPP